MQAFVVSDKTGNILGIYKSIKDAESEHGKDINLDKYSHPTMTFEEFVSLQKNGIQ